MFTGCDGICELLRERCLPSKNQVGPRVHKIFVLYGLGGSGKTQVCLKFAQDYREKYEHLLPNPKCYMGKHCILTIFRFWGIFWIDASRDETAERGYLEIAETCGFEKKDLNTIKRQLSNIKERWLLVIDNADDPSINISRYFPTGDRGTILVTTRNHNCRSHQTVGSWEFGGMEPEDAVALLLKTACAADDTSYSLRTSARNIVEDLGYLALAIAQAGAFIREQHYTMEEYHEVYSRHRMVLLSHRPSQDSSDYRYSVYTTWEVSIEKIASASNQIARDAIEILQFFSFLHFERISEEIFKNSWTNLRKFKHSKWTLSNLLGLLCRSGSLDWDPCPFREAVGLLSAYSLVSIHQADNHKLFSMHPLVHAWSRDRLATAERKKSLLMAVVTLAMSIPRSYQLSNIQFRRLLLPHVESCLKLCGGELFLEGDAEKERLEIAFWFSFVPHGVDLLKAKQLQEEVVEAQKKLLGECHFGTLLSMHCLACSYYGLGRFEEAKQLREKVVVALGRMRGEDHPNTLLSMHSLASSYWSVGQYEEAKQLTEKVIKIQKRVLGETHPNTLLSMHNLAHGYWRLGRYAEAKQLIEKVVEGQKRTLGEDHPDTLRSIHGLAPSYWALGKYEEAKVLMEKVIEAQGRALGKDHPNTVESMHSLAHTYWLLGQYGEAKRFMERVIEIQKRKLGEDHPNTLQSMHNLAQRYWLLDQYGETNQLVEKVIEGQERTLGGDHPHTLLSIHSLASSYRRLGRFEEARRLMEKVVKGQKRTLGENHASTIASTKYLKLLKSYQDPSNGAVPLQENTERKPLGRDDSVTDPPSKRPHSSNTPT
jgi:tetratricopeptide (TPR) repeat protein